MSKIDQLYKEWLSVQPLSAENLRLLDKKFMLDFNYNSNHIEGNTLTYGQTELLFMFGETTGNASLKDYEEMKAHNIGLEMIKTEASDKERPLTESFIRVLNKTILVQNYWKDAKTPDGQPTRMEVSVGVYKTRPNSVITATGERFDYASPEETPAFMADLVAWFNSEEQEGSLSPIELAALLHYRYIRIHPFEDGNGRIARLLVNYVLKRYDYPMLVIRTEDKDNYLRILHLCDIQVGLSPSNGAKASIEQIAPFVEYLNEELERAFVLSIKAAKGESVEEEGDWRKKMALNKKRLMEIPLFTVELAQIVLEKSLAKLVQAIESELLVYKEIFDDINYKIILLNDYGNTYFVNNFENISVSYNYKNNVSVLFELNRKSLYKDHSFMFEIKCEFSDQKYIIEERIGDDELSCEKTYSQYLTDLEIKQVIEFTGSRLAKFVEENIIINE